MRVLIAEDDSTSRRVLEAVLKKWGYEVLSVADGEAAWEALRRDDAPRLAILDWMMPGMDGVEVCRKVRRLGTPAPTYIILLTALDGRENLVSGFDAGADDYVTKPFDKDELRARVKVGGRIVELQHALANRVREIEGQKEELEKENAGRQRAERAMQESEMRYRLLFELSPLAVGVQVADALVFINIAVLKVLGALEREDVLGKSLVDFVHPEVREAVEALLRTVEHEGGQEARFVETRLVRTDEGIVDAEVRAAATIYQGEAAVQIIIQDITERKRLERELVRLSRQDGLTGIANRRVFDEVLEQECRRATRSHSPLSLLMIDIDEFKAYNDNYGHQAGDDCLRHVAAVLKNKAVRPSDLAARYGGEEFAVILPQTDTEGAAWVAEKMRAGVEALDKGSADPPLAQRVTISLGVATVVPDKEPNPAQLTSAADQALYEAKESGRNQVRMGITPSIGGTD